MASAQLLGIEDDAIARGLEALDGVPGRFEAVDEGQPFTVSSTTRTRPTRWRTCSLAARELDDGRVICVFGCGGDRDREKRPMMGRIASELADIAIVTSDNPRSEDPRAIIDEIVAGADGELEVVPDRREAIARAIEAARDGDVVADRRQGPRAGAAVP